MSTVKLQRALIALSPLALSLPMAMDIYVPAVPRITQQFHSSVAQMQLSLNLFMLVSGFIQMTIGPLADRFGRRAVVAVATTLFALGSLCCALSTSLAALIASRLIQAAGSCSMVVMAFTVARDLFSGVTLARCYSLLSGINAFSPLLAPFIGAYLDMQYGWPATFYILLLIAFFSYVLYFPLLPETWPEEKRIPLTGQVWQQYRAIGSHPVFILYALAASMGLSYLFLFCTMSPVLLMSILHVSESNYGFYFGFMGVSFLLGSGFSAYVVGVVGVYKTVVLGFMITLLGGLFLLWSHVHWGVCVAGFVYPMLLIGLGGTCSMTAGSAGAVELFKQQAGVASAFAAGCRFVFSAVAGLVIANHIHSALPLGVPAVLFSLLGTVLFLCYRTTLMFSTEGQSDG